MSRISTKKLIIQAQQQVYEQMRFEFLALGRGGRYSERQREYAFNLIDEFGVRATSRILRMPRRTLQRWCRRSGVYVKRCPYWIYRWAEKRRKRREFWQRRGYY
jgi:hypothetical protein